ncbi:MAG: flagellar filament capping protein FliD [Gammaproteobacteria bacterium]|nr:flagellar filament capping protein FliD [Gammaproteobacteria bacterium]
MAGSTDYLNTIGAGSGLDTKAIVTAMVNAEKAAPQASIDRRSEDVTADISGVAKVKSALAALQTAFKGLDDKNDFNFATISNSGTAYVKASLDGTLAQSGSYNIEVNSLAKAEMRQSAEFTSTTSDLNAGAAFSFTVQVGSGTAQTVSLAAGGVTLDNAAKAINDLDMGVAAWVVQNAAGKYKLLTQGPTGAANTVTVTDTNDLFGLNQNSAKVQTATDADVDINGVNVVRSSNNMNDLIPGVSIDLQSTSAQAFNLSVGRDMSVAQAAITKVVTAVNDFETVMKEVTAVKDANGEPGPLKSDAGIKAIRDKLRDFMITDSSTPGTSITSASNMGISVQRDGSFKVDSVKLASALVSNFDDVTKMFSANTNNQTTYGTANRGLAGDMVKQISDYLASSGIIKTREAAYSKTQSTLTSEQQALDTKMAGVEERYTKQFTTMNKIMDEMKNMQKYLESQLENLPFTSNND